MKTTLKFALVIAAIALVGGLALTTPANAQGFFDEDCINQETVEVIVGFSPLGQPIIGTQEVDDYNSSDCDVIQDDRINKDDRAAEAAIYCNQFGVDIYDIDTFGPATQLAFRATWAEVEAVPTSPSENTLIDGVPGFALYRLTSGEMQLNGPFDWEGKQYVFIWEGCSRPTSD
ncbi:MAG: hypothetical protein AAF125_03630 [Chloroflexota bacterium]